MPTDAALQSPSPAFVTVQYATNIILSIAKCLPPVTVPIQDAVGAILAEDLFAPEPLPPFPASIKVPSLPILILIFFITERIRLLLAKYILERGLFLD